MWKYAYDVKRRGESKFSVIFRDADSANKFVQGMYKKRSDIFPHSCWLAYVPDYKISRTVITFDLDANENPDEILNEIREHPECKIPWVPPSSVKCLRKRMNNNEVNKDPKYVNSNVFIFTFNSLLPPTAAIYLGRRIKFHPFIQKVRRCVRCQRFGHLVHLCRSNPDSAFCDRCAGKGHDSSSCSSKEIKCIKCIRRKANDTNHPASSTDCPTYLENKKIKIVMAKTDFIPNEATQFLKRFGQHLDDNWFDTRNVENR